MGNDYEKVDLEGLDLTITSTEEPRTATLERVWLDDPRPRAGPHGAAEGADAHVPRRGSRSGRCRSRFRPTRAARCRCSSPTARASSQIEQREARTPQPPRASPQIIRALNKAPRNNTLYVGCSAPTPAPSSTASGCRRCRRRCSASSKPTGTAATSTRCTARRSASGSCRPTRPSAARGRSRSPCRRTDRRPSGFQTPMSISRQALRVLGPSAIALAFAAAAVTLTPRRRSSSRPRRQADFLKGDVDRPVDRQPGPADARPGHRAGLRDVGAVSLVARAAAPTARCLSGPATKARSSASAPTARARCSSTRPSSRCTRWRRRPTAGSTSARRPTARSTRSSATGASTTFFDPGREIHLGARASTRPATSTPAPARKA